MADLCPDGLNERRDAQNVDDACQVIGEHGECHLGSHVFQPLHQEVGRTHPHLDRAEGMFDGLPTLTHGLWVLIEPPLNRFQNIFVLPATDPAFLARRCNDLSTSTHCTEVGPVPPNSSPRLVA